MQCKNCKIELLFLHNTRSHNRCKTTSRVIGSEVHICSVEFGCFWLMWVKLEILVSPISFWFYKPRVVRCHRRNYRLISIKFWNLSGYCRIVSLSDIAGSRFTDRWHWLSKTCVRGAEHTSGLSSLRAVLVLVHEYIQSGLRFLILAE